MFLVRYLLYPLQEGYFFFSWILWLFSCLTLAGGQSIVVLFTVVRISICLFLYFVVITLKRFQLNVLSFFHSLNCAAAREKGKNRIPRLRKQLKGVRTLRKYVEIAGEIDRLSGAEEWKRKVESADFDSGLLLLQLNELNRCRLNNDVRGLMFSLQNVFHRHYCGMNNERLYVHSLTGTKYCIEDFLSRIVEQLSFIAKEEFKGLSLRAKLRFFQRARKSYGRTALCLSGGGALAMYHAGVIKAMIQGNCLPSIINGTSGGSIIAGVLATRTLNELKDPRFLNPTIANRYGCRWLPTLHSQISTFLRSRVLMDYREFIQTAKTYYGEYTTFEEAYKRTGRDVSITVSYANRVVMNGISLKSSALVLNHIASPHVLVWSAVTCSCALPGLMKPQILMAKNYDNSIVPYSPLAQSYLDGSLQADAPMQRLTELFNAQQSIVSQVNPHVAPFLSNQLTKHKVPFLSQCEKFLEADIHHRLKRLAKMKVIPKVYGQDFSEVFSGKQRYTGDITIVPNVSFRMQFKVLSHPSHEDMEEYFREGERATWEKISILQNTQIIEKTLEECIKAISRQIYQQQQKEKMIINSIATNSSSSKKTMTNPTNPLPLPVTYERREGEEEKEGKPQPESVALSSSPSCLPSNVVHSSESSSPLSFMEDLEAECSVDPLTQHSSLLLHDDNIINPDGTVNVPPSSSISLPLRAKNNYRHEGEGEREKEEEQENKSNAETVDVHSAVVNKKMNTIIEHINNKKQGDSSNSNSNSSEKDEEEDEGADKEGIDLGANDPSLMEDINALYLPFQRRSMGGGGGGAGAEGENRHETESEVDYNEFAEDIAGMDSVGNQFSPSSTPRSSRHHSISSSASASKAPSFPVHPSDASNSSSPSLSSRARRLFQH